MNNEFSGLLHMSICTAPEAREEIIKSSSTWKCLPKQNAKGPLGEDCLQLTRLHSKFIEACS